MGSINLDIVIEKNDLLSEKIKKTNDSYKSLIISINNFTKKELSYTIGSLFKKDNEIITKIILTKYDNLDHEWGGEPKNIYASHSIGQSFHDEYIFIGTSVYSQNYLCNNMKFSHNKNNYSGKWMIFGTLCEMLDYWKIIRMNTYMNNLGFFSKFIGDEKNRVICVYFEDYRDKENILENGKILKEMIDYKLPMYFKTNEMTKKNKYGLGSWKYMIEGDKYEFIN